jgi:hypothetical protein
MKTPPSPSDAGGLEWWADPDPIITQRLVAHLAPSDAPFQSRHRYSTTSDRPTAYLPRPDVLLMEVAQDRRATLFRYAADGEYCGETWHASVEEAMDEAAHEYGEAIIGPWQAVPEGEADAHAFAIRQADARRRGPLGPRCDRMTAEEWRRSEDVPAMLRALRAGWHGAGADFVLLTHRYLLACCRAIWRLLPMEASRRGVEVAERYIEGRATAKELGDAEWLAEGDAFFLDPFEFKPEDEEAPAREYRIRYEAERRAHIDPLVQEVEAIPPEELRRMVRREPADGPIDPRRLLADAAYFADSAIAYPGIRPRVSIIQEYKQFLSAPLLREIAGDSFCPELSGPERIA